ncbi:MAG: hypothetical protein J7J30_04445 [Candidatus Odinarchaeota archaeon]|nr:hypothetical protein [Candidatus Odinarchaeota archaeon]
MDRGKSKQEIIYHYMGDGFLPDGTKIPDIPVVYLVLEVGEFRARGPAILDTGFDGGVYPNIDIVKLFEGTKPIKTVEFENPLFQRSEFEVYVAKAYLYYSGEYVPIGDVNVYIPVEPELLGEEVIIGREVINRWRMVLDSEAKVLRVLLR